MPDRGPQVSQVRSYVNESGFLERTGRRTVLPPAITSPSLAIMASASASA
jgi:hypothetical protein